MNEEYLWNKQGADAEIERLENSLKALRYQENAPPALPAKQLDFEEKRARRWFPFAFAFAASAAIVLLAFVFLFRFAENAPEKAENFTETPAPPVAEKAVSQNPPAAIEKDEAAPVKRTEFTAAKSRRSNLPKSVVKVSEKQSAPKTSAKKPAIKLTDEEKYAYGQLMLALSITNSKLNIVKDKMKVFDEIGVVKTER